MDPFLSGNAVNRCLGAAAQQEDDKKNRNRNTQQPKQNITRGAGFFDFLSKFHSSSRNIVIGSSRTRSGHRLRLRYPPWAMAPIVSATKPAATAIATFNSIDNFIISPFNYGGEVAAPHCLFLPFLTLSNLSALADVRGRPQSQKPRVRWTFAARITCCTDDASGLDDGSHEKSQREKNFSEMREAVDS